MDNELGDWIERVHLSITILDAEWLGVGSVAENAVVSNEADAPEVAL
jgi:hypothetical protein